MRAKPTSRQGWAAARSPPTPAAATPTEPIQPLSRMIRVESRERTR